jgi:hypothetical protein
MSDQILLAPSKTRGRKSQVGNGEVAAVERLIDPPTVNKTVDLPEWKLEVCEIHIVGKSPLITHAWSEKAIKMMLDKQMGIASKGREKKDPFADFKGSLYPVVGDVMQFGMPAPAFKACSVTAANSVELKMTQMRQAFHVNFYTVPITGEPITKPLTDWDVRYKKELAPYHKLGISMRMDVVRLETGVADLRFRAWWPKWKAKLEVEYNPRMITLPQLVNLIRAGGEGCGVGEWRPSSPHCRSGEYGRFTIA